MSLEAKKNIYLFLIFKYSIEIYVIYLATCASLPAINTPESFKHVHVQPPPNNLIADVCDYAIPLLPSNI